MSFLQTFPLRLSRVALAALVLCAAPSRGRTPDPARPPITIQVTDLTPKFLRFYREAIAEHAGPDRRFHLWKRDYDFAALPPVPERDRLARELLDKAWPTYPEVMGRIRAGAAGMRPAPEPILRSVAAKLGLDRPLKLQMIVYVGCREKNAFFFAANGKLNIAVPVEESPEWRGPVLTHELTHAVNQELAGFSEGWERSIARTLFQEGLAMRVTESLLPGRGDAAYVEARPGWLAAAEAKQTAILKAIRPELRASDSATVMRFTMGKGPNGLEREAYYAGWVVVGHLLRTGHTFPELARIPEDRLPALVDQAIGEILARTASNSSTARGTRQRMR